MFDIQVFHKENEGEKKTHTIEIQTKQLINANSEKKYNPMKKKCCIRKMIAMKLQQIEIG